ncbi:MAG: ABC transporter permease [Chloroflexia bacterium]
MQRLLKRLIRISAFLSKEIAEVRRQPRLVLSLILGPFLILLIFGAGYVGESGRLSAIIVVPRDGGYSVNPAEYREMVGDRLSIAGVTTDEAGAISRLNRHDVDVVVVVPADASKQIAAGGQAKLPIYYNEVDPLHRDYINYLTYLYTNEINKQTVAAAAGQGQESAGDIRTAIQRMRNSLAAAENRLDAGDRTGAGSQVQNMQGSTTDIEIGLAVLSQVLTTTTPLIKPAAPTSDSSSRPSQNVSLVESRAVINRLNNDLKDLNDELATPNPDRQRAKERISRVRQDLDDLDKLTEQFQRINPLVLAAPFYATPTNKAPIKVSFTSFYAPGVMVLLLQHIGITLAALSMVRERLLGTVELFRVSPVSPSEILIGKYLSFMIFLGVVAAALLALMSNELSISGYGLSLGVPVLGDWALLVLTLALVSFASLGLGYVIAAVSRSESQAVQLAMLVLLTSVFFSGFFLRIETFFPAVQAVSYALPVTYGIQALQTIMLRGGVPTPALLLALLMLGTLFALLSFILFQREFKKG